PGSPSKPPSEAGTRSLRGRGAMLRSPAGQRPLLRPGEIDRHRQIDLAAYGHVDARIPLADAGIEGPIRPARLRPAAPVRAGARAALPRDAALRDEAAADTGVIGAIGPA